MEDKKDAQKNGMNGKTCPCGCGSCGCTAGGGMGHWHGGMLLRVLIGLVALLVAFWIGVRVGEFRDELLGRGGFGRSGYGRMMTYPGGMMRGGYGSGGVPIPPVPVNASSSVAH